VVDNPWIRSWSFENLTFVFTKPYFRNFLPLHLVSYMFDYSIWKLNPFGYHLHSVVLNAINAALAVVVVRTLSGSLAVGFLAGLFWAIHPSHVEAVAWVSIRKDVFSTTFLLLTVYFYAISGSGRSRRWGPYVASVVCFTLGLLAKVSIVVLPAFLLLLDALPRSGRGRFEWKEALANKIPYGLVGIVLVHLNDIAQVKAKSSYALEPLRYLMVKGQACWSYLGLLTGWFEGRPIYDTPNLPLSALAVVGYLAGLAFLPAVAALAFWKGRRTLALGAGWMFTLLLPAVAFPLVTYMADRYLYAPSLGFCWLLAVGIIALGERVPGRALRLAAVAALAAIPLTLFAVRTAHYLPVWTDSEHLWTDAIKKSSDFRAYNNLAQVRLEQRRWEDAEDLLMVALGRTDLDVVKQNMARVRIEQKRWAEAESLLAVTSDKDNLVSYLSLAVLYYNTQRYQLAVQAVERAADVADRKGADATERGDLEYTRGAIYWVLGRKDDAVASWERALAANPRHPKAREWIGIARGNAK
jgi:predicted negative regulator of RcsB-dependent stress response